MSFTQPSLANPSHPHPLRTDLRRGDLHFSGEQPAKTKTPSPPADGMGTGLVRVANKGVDWFVRNLYDRGPSVRYAVEQTGGYTIPRILQQWNRTRSLTGQANPMAAMEMGIREVLADFADTFLPGLLSKGISRVLDKRHHTLLSRNIGSEGLGFYNELLLRKNGKYTSQPEFLERLEKRLQEVARRNQPSYEFQDLNLKARIKRIVKDKKAIPNEVKELAIQLGLPHAGLRLRQKGHPFRIDLPDLLQDLRDIHMATGVSANPHRVAWGEQMHRTLNMTRQKMPHQMWGLLAAVGASLSIPFAVRLITRWYYNEDSFPGTKELHDAFPANTALGEALGVAKPSKDTEIDVTKKRFVIFPYLKESWQRNDMLPSLGTAAFFVVLGLMVRRRFNKQHLSIMKPAHWLKVYEFNRDAPISTLAQMELTYGLLCGTRLASSRDDSEYRETGLRDCVLGWPTLTYGFAAMQKLMGRAANIQLKKKFGHPTLLLTHNRVFRNGSDIASHYFNNLGLGEKADAALISTRMAHRWVTFACAGINWALLAYAEPQIGIWLTNKLEVNKIEDQKQLEDAEAAMQKRMHPPPTPASASTNHANSSFNPFLNYSSLWRRQHEPDVCAGTSSFN